MQLIGILEIGEATNKGTPITFRSSLENCPKIEFWVEGKTCKVTHPTGEIVHIQLDELDRAINERPHPLGERESSQVPPPPLPV